MYKLIKKLFEKDIQKDIDTAIDELKVELKKQAVLESLAKRDSITEEIKKKESKASLCITFNNGDIQSIRVPKGDEYMLHKLISAQFNESPILWYSMANKEMSTVYYFRKSDIRSMKLILPKED